MSALNYAATASETTSDHASSLHDFFSGFDINTLASIFNSTTTLVSAILGLVKALA